MDDELDYDENSEDESEGIGGGGTSDAEKSEIKLLPVKIVDKRITCGVLEYSVRWTSRGRTYRSWMTETEAVEKSDLKLVEEFNMKNAFISSFDEDDTMSDDEQNTDTFDFKRREKDSSDIEDRSLPGTTDCGDEREASEIFSPEHLQLKLTDKDALVISGKHEERSPNGEYSQKSCTIQSGDRPEDLNSSLDSCGRLKINVPVPEPEKQVHSTTKIITTSQQHRDWHKDGEVPSGFKLAETGITKECKISSEKQVNSTTTESEYKERGRPYPATNPTTNLLTCSLCRNEDFVNIAAYDAHVNNHHQKIRGKFRECATFNEDQDPKKLQPVYRIVDKVICSEGVMYMVRWRGYGEKNNNWELESCLRCPKLIYNFELKREKDEEKKKKDEEKKKEEEEGSITGEKRKSLDSKLPRKKSRWASGAATIPPCRPKPPRVELDSRCQTISVDCNHITVSGGTGGKTGNVTTYLTTPGNAESTSSSVTPMSKCGDDGIHEGSITPQYGTGNQTPLHDGSKTPALDLTVTSTPVSNDSNSDYSSTIRNPATPGCKAPQTPADNSKHTSKYSPYQQETPDGNGIHLSGSDGVEETAVENDRNELTPYPIVGSPSSVASATSSVTHGGSLASHSSPHHGQYATEWQTTGIEVMIKETHPEPGLRGQIGVAKNELWGVWTVLLKEKAVHVRSDQLKLTVPKSGDFVKIMGSDLDGNIGVLKMVDGLFGVVQIQNELKIQSLSSLGRLRIILPVPSHLKIEGNAPSALNYNSPTTPSVVALPLGDSQHHIAHHHGRPSNFPSPPQAKHKFPNFMRFIPPEGDPLANRFLFVGNLENNITEEELRRIFERFGTILEIKIKINSHGNAFAFVKFVNLDMAARAKSEFSGQKIGNLLCKLGYGRTNPTSTVWVGGLGDWATFSQLEREFGRFGSIKKIEWIPGGPYAYITYETVDAAQAAVKDMRGSPLGGSDKRIRTDFADAADPPIGSPLHNLPGLLGVPGSNSGVGGGARASTTSGVQ